MQDRYWESWLALLLYGRLLRSSCRSSHCTLRNWDV